MISWKLDTCFLNFRHPLFQTTPWLLLKLNLRNLIIWRSTSELLISCFSPLLKQVNAYNISISLLTRKEPWQNYFMKQNRERWLVKLDQNSGLWLVDIRGILASDWSADVTILLMIATITSNAPQWPALSLLSGSIANCRPQSHAFKPLLPCQHNALTRESLLKIQQDQAEAELWIE